MLNQILEYCDKNEIKYIFLDFFGTIVQRNCLPEEIKVLWAKNLAKTLCYIIDEKQLLALRQKAEQAVISRSEAGEFNYVELCDEIFRRIIELDSRFRCKYNGVEFYRIAHSIEVQAELTSQIYIKETIKLINQAYSKGIHLNVISDFYLGQDELKIFLRKEEVAEKIEYFFVSSDYRTSKHNGGLYKYACQKLGVNASECIMIGDNKKSDVQNAEVFGIKSFLINSSQGESQRNALESAIIKISRSSISGVLGYSNYCFLLYLYLERLYKSLIREGIKDIYFLSREGEFLKKLFDRYISKRGEDAIHTHYLYVSRKATYPATLKRLNEENFDLLRRFPQFSILDFFENIGMLDAVTKLEFNYSEIEKPIKDFFHSSTFYKLCARKDFQELYEHSRIQNNSLLKKYCKQEGMITDHTIAIADVGWNGTMQDNILKAFDGIDCIGLYIGLMNTAYKSEYNKKWGLIFSENPQDSRDLNWWKYDHVFMERILWASHGATDHYRLEENGCVSPVLKEYKSESDNYELMRPVQDAILKKINALDCFIFQSCYSAENFYEEFLHEHTRMLFHVNYQQIDLQRKMIKGQMQNFGHISTAGDSIGAIFSKKRIIKKFWSSLYLLKNTEVVFRILLNHNHKICIKLLYRLHYRRIKRQFLEGTKKS